MAVVGPVHLFVILAYTLAKLVMLVPFVVVLLCVILAARRQRQRRATAPPPPEVDELRGGLGRMAQRTQNLEEILLHTPRPTAGPRN